jgi:hypothetical protein
MNSSSVWLVQATIYGCCPPFFLMVFLIASVVSYPFIMGMLKSIKIKPYYVIPHSRDSFTNLIASLPLDA